MKKVTIVIFGKTMESIAECAEEAANSLANGSPSDNRTFNDRSHFDYTVKESSDEEYCENTNEDPES